MVYYDCRFDKPTPHDHRRQQVSAIRIEQRRIEVTIVTITADVPDDSTNMVDADIIMLARQQMSLEQEAALEGILTGAKLVKDHSFTGHFQ